MTAHPDPRIAEYVEEVSRPGIPFVSRSHCTLANLYAEHGRETIDRLLREYWTALREEKRNPHDRTP